MEIYYDEIDGDVLVLTADGGLNKQTAESFVGDIEKLIEAGLTKIIIDCAKLTYVSSVGLGVLVRLHRRMKSRGGEVKVCNVRSVLSDVLHLARLHRVFEIYPDLNQARAAMTRAGS